ncbi:MAG TPA: phosphoprotein phosphatase [Gammaproteobacteria bacterium]|nr:phosphoprotein phosphatase [Gammaproteobacteria bacterium]
MQNFLFKFFPINRSGRDFVVGDIHGMFNSLEELLDKISFNPKIDRVFSVGDLIDRGKQSNRVLEFLDKPWFFSVMGNHESMLLDARFSEYNLHNWVKYNGGGWWKKLSKATQDDIYYKISKLPYLFEIETKIGCVGVAHADLPFGRSWVDIVRAISTDDDLKQYILWSRQRHKNMRLTNSTSPIKGIKLVVMGHTPYKKPLHRQNIVYIDTGATYQNDERLSTLTLLQIHPSTKMHQYSTYKELQYFS